MFDDIEVTILGNKPSNNIVKSILADVQEYDGSIKLDNVELDINKRLFIDYIEEDISINSYISIDKINYKIVKVNIFSDYMEVFISEYENVKINDIERYCLIKDNDDKIIDYKTIITDVVIECGNIIEYENSKWLIVGEVEKGKYSFNATMRKMNHTLKMYLGGKLCIFPCILEMLDQSIFENNYIKVAEGQLRVTTSFNKNMAELIIIDKSRFIKNYSAWVVNAINTCKLGLLEIIVDADVYTPDDDKENEIADRWKYEINHNYTMDLDTTDIILQQEHYKQLSPIIKDRPNNGAEVVVNNPSIIYTVNNNNCTISNTGLITGVNVGTSIITVQFENIIKTININITAKDIVTYTYKFKTINVDNVAYVDATTIEVEQNKTKTLAVTEIEKITTKNGSNTSEIITNPSVVYSVDNSNVNIDTTGLITGATVGTSIITISYTATDNTTITKNINVSCVGVQTLTITGEETIALENTEVYTSNKPCVWYLADINNNTGKPWATIVSYTDTTCTVKATSSWIFDDGYKKYFFVQADGKADASEYFALKVKLTQF